MYEIHDVFAIAIKNPYLDKQVRVLKNSQEFVLLINMKTNCEELPFKISRSTWIELVISNCIVKIEDPYLHLSYKPTNLSPKAEIRYRKVLEIVTKISTDEQTLCDHMALHRAIEDAANSVKQKFRTVRPWVCEWLRSGRNPCAVVAKSCRNKEDKTAQKTGTQRGRKLRISDHSPNVPAYKAQQQMEMAYQRFIAREKMTWSDAYYRMATQIYKIPIDALIGDKSTKGILLDPVLREKYDLPSHHQFRYFVRHHKKSLEVLDNELPKGSRGKAIDRVNGPGYFEIDATGFQIQLVSRLTRAKLIGSPWVYLIVDIFSGAIVGYSVTLENPSWASAAHALFNCFSDKQKVFDRLNMPFKSTDWPCHHLPNYLRADRAELISNIGEDFTSSGIKVEVCASMDPEAKGTVEGKNSELKREQPGRFNLPGRFEKMRTRRRPSGKKDAALNIFEFEQIIVEIIMDLNNEPVDPKHLTPDALEVGPSVASRVGFFEWGITHRAGYTLKDIPNFVYEYLLTNSNGLVTPSGIHLGGEVFNCDALRTSNLLVASVGNHFKIPVAYDKNYAAEIFFLDPQTKLWIPAHNIDPEIYSLNASFPEAKNYRALQNSTAQQADLNAYIQRSNRLPFIRSTIKKAVSEKRVALTGGKIAMNQIRESRSEERAAERKNSLGNTLVKRKGSPGIRGNKPLRAGTVNPIDSIDDLWSEVNEAE